MLVILLLFQLILFTLIQAIPQNYAELELAISGLEELETPSSTSEPPPKARFLDWLEAFYSGNLGESTDPRGGSVSELLLTRVPRTLLLLIPATLGGFLLGLWLGKRVAWQRSGKLEFFATLGGTAFYTSFPPWLAFVAIYVFALTLKWLPPEKLIDPMKWLDQDLSLNEVILRILLTMALMGLAYLLLAWLTRTPSRRNARLRWIGGIGIILIAVGAWIASGLAPFAADILVHLALPVGLLILLSFGETMLVMRTTMLESMCSDQVSAARGRGLSEVCVRDRYAARIAILPVLSRFVVYLPYVIIGAFVLEKFFAWDGMGQALFEATRNNDLPVLMGVLSLVGISILFAHFFFDLLTAWLDPRLRGAQAE